MVLGPDGSVEGFDSFWTAASAAVPDLLPSAGYPHHRLGDADEFATMLDTAGWAVDRIETVVSSRVCSAEQLWRWLWGSLPIMRADRTYLDDTTRRSVEAQIRSAFFEVVEPLRCDDDEYVIKSAGLLACATASVR